MKKKLARNFLVLLLILALPSTAYAYYGSIQIDGYYDDWEDKPHTEVFNGKNPPESKVNHVSLFRDETNAYVHIIYAQKNNQSIVNMRISLFSKLGNGNYYVVPDYNSFDNEFDSDEKKREEDNEENNRKENNIETIVNSDNEPDSENSKSSGGDTDTDADNDTDSNGTDSNDTNSDSRNKSDENLNDEAGQGNKQLFAGAENEIYYVADNSNLDENQNGGMVLQNPDEITDPFDLLNPNDPIDLDDLKNPVEQNAGQENQEGSVNPNNNQENQGEPLVPGPNEERDDDNDGDQNAVQNGDLDDDQDGDLDDDQNGALNDVQNGDLNDVQNGDLNDDQNGALNDDQDSDLNDDQEKDQDEDWDPFDPNSDGKHHHGYYGTWPFTVYQGHYPVGYGYFTRSEGEPDQAEFYIPLDTITDQPDGITELSMVIKKLGKQSVICVGASSAPYLGAAIGAGIAMVSCAAYTYRKRPFYNKGK